MDGPQDLGGRHGFGPVLAEPDEPPFHADWERRAFALTLAMGGTGAWTLDASRHARERMAPARYLAANYYAVWLDGLERLIAERGLASASEIASGAMTEPPAKLPRVVRAADVPALLSRGAPSEREGKESPRFRPGDRVRTVLRHVASHTRLPIYARGRVGTVARLHGRHVFPDTNAHGEGESPRFLYSVAFAARDLWGEEAEARDAVHLDLFEPYLEPA